MVVRYVLHPDNTVTPNYTSVTGAVAAADSGDVIQVHNGLVNPVLSVNFYKDATKVVLGFDSSDNQAFDQVLNNSAANFKKAGNSGNLFYDTGIVAVGPAAAYYTTSVANFDTTFRLRVHGSARLQAGDLQIGSANADGTNFLENARVSSTGDLRVGSSSASNFTVAAASGNTVVAGTLGVTGASSLSSVTTTGNASVGGTLGVTGVVTLSNLNALGVVHNAANGVLSTSLVQTADIAALAVTTAKIASSAVTSTELASNAVTTAKILDTNVTLAKLENVSSAQLILGNGSNRPTATTLSGDATISNTGVLTVGGSAITTSKIADANVTLNKLENLSSAQLIVGNGSNRPTAVSLSGDATLSNAGALTIGNSAVTTSKIADANVTLAKLSNLTATNIIVGDATNRPVAVAMSGDATLSNAGALTIGNSAVNTSKLADGAITAVKIAAGAVETAKLADSSVTATQIAANAVTTAKIADANVTLAKLENVTSANIIVGDATNRPVSVALSGDATLSNAGALTIANSAVTTAKHADSSVTTVKIADANVTLAKLSNLTATNIIVGDATNRPAAVAMSGDATLSNAGALTIANSAVTTAKLAANAVTAAKIAAGTITATELAAGSITNASITDNTISSNKIAIEFTSGANLGNVAHAINTTGKFLYKMVYNTTNGLLYFAQGTNANSAWKSSGNASDNVTPA